MPKLEIMMLGNLNILYDGNSILHKMSSKAAGLLCYLALNEGKLIGRDKLAQLFWDGSNMEAARYNLRYTLWSIRRFLKNEFSDIDIIVNRKNCCMLNECLEVSSDVALMRQNYNDIKKNGAEIRTLEAVRGLYKGEFLENFEVKNCFELNDWIFYERENLQRKYFDVLNLLAHEYRLQQKYDKCIETYEEMLHINPLMEELYVELMKIYMEIGDRNTAINQYERCREILREELNIAPMESTRNAYEEIKSSCKRTVSIVKTESRPENDNSLSGIVCTYNDIFFQKELADSSHTSRIITQCIPIDSLNFYWLWELVDEIISRNDADTLKSVPGCYWRDLSAIHSGASEYLEDAAANQGLAGTYEKTRIFTSALSLLKAICENGRQSIFIRDFQYIDDMSLEFLMFLMFNAHKLNVYLCIHLKDKCEKMDMLKQYFNIMEL